MALCEITNPTAYEILGVPPDASSQEIHQKYKRLALRLHPDKGGGDDAFKQLNEAFRLVGDVDERLKYDEELADKEVYVRATLEDLFAQASKTVNVTKKTECMHCARRDCCSTCQGQGKITRHSEGIRIISPLIANSGFLLLSASTSCPGCGGSGVNPLLPDCLACKGSRLLSYQVCTQVALNPTLRDGDVITLPGTQTSAILRLEPHPTFTVEGLDLVCTLTISLKESLLGCTREVLHPSGKRIQVTLPPLAGAIPRSAVVEGLGLQDPKNRSKEGNVLVRFAVEYPRTLSAHSRDFLDKLIEW